MIRLKLFYKDDPIDLNEVIDKWVDKKKPTIIRAKMETSGYYKYEVLVTYEDNAGVTL